MLVDTHCHLNFPSFEKDLDKVVKNALNNGVEKIICVSSNLEDSKRAIDIVRHYQGIVFAAVGIHPQKTDPDNTESLDSQLDKLAELAQLPQVVAIGECGLDYAPAPPSEEDRSKEEQFFLFKSQLELAQKLNLPVIVHSRRAFDDVSSIINQQLTINNVFGVLHCYSAGKKEIKRIADLGFYFGIDGNLTYDSGLQNVLKEIPPERLLLETDSPFLTPVPFRGLRNEPANVKIIAEFAAKITGVSLERISQTTTQNVQKLFNKIR